ncbi:hypothetical protein Tco_0659571, partial [Tanacetum coccineum]
TPVKQSKPAPAPTKKPSKHKLPQKIRREKPSFQLVDEDDEAQQESAWYVLNYTYLLPLKTS